MTIYTIPDTISADGSKEVSQDINAWLASVPNGISDQWNEIRFAIDGIYWTDSPITMTGRRFVAIDGRGSSFQRKTRSAIRWFPHWQFTQCEHFAYNNIIVKGEADPAIGYDATREAQHAFALLGCVDSRSVYCEARDVWGDIFNFAADSTGSGSTQHLVSWFDGHGGVAHRQCVSITAGRRIEFDTCHFGYSCRSAVDLEPNTNHGYATYILFEDCIWEGHRLGWLTAASRCGDVSDVTMVDCQDALDRTRYTSAALGVNVYCDPTYYVSYEIPPQRTNFRIESCSTPSSSGNPNGATMMFRNTGGDVVVTNNIVKLDAGRTPPMRVARFDSYTTKNAVITYEGNTEDLG